MAAGHSKAQGAALTNTSPILPQDALAEAQSLKVAANLFKPEERH